MNHPKTEIEDSNGKPVLAQAPVIISASRATDIPAFYSEWFIERLKKGYLKWKNPFNNKSSFVSFKNTRLVVFWSKNPKPIIKYLDAIMKQIPNFYFLFTLNEYENEYLEKNLPPLNKRIETFIELSEQIGKDKVLWRFDPLILTDKISIDTLISKINLIGSKIKNHTSKLIFSYARIGVYQKVKRNLIKDSINYLEFTNDTKIEFAKKLQSLAKDWNIEIASCAEDIDLSDYGIAHNKCIDDDLIIKLFGNDEKLMDYLGVKTIPVSLFEPTKIIKSKILKDKGQRKDCACIISKDIGQYNTCPHGCVYCYANINQNLALANYEKHRKNIISETIIP